MASNLFRSRVVSFYLLLYLSAFCSNACAIAPRRFPRWTVSGTIGLTGVFVSSRAVEVDGLHLCLRCCVLAVRNFKGLSLAESCLLSPGC